MSADDVALWQFRKHFPELQQHFFRIAAESGKPRDLKWLSIDWLDERIFARDHESGILNAYVNVNVKFEAVAGGDMEEVAAVSTVRDGSAVFHYIDGHWGIGGRVLFNISPDTVISSLEGEHTVVDATVIGDRKR